MLTAAICFGDFNPVEDRAVDRAVDPVVDPVVGPVVGPVAVAPAKQDDLHMGECAHK